ncbi:hypothetical protein P5V15_013632 [Pogonomyrmex californicus]
MSRVFVYLSVFFILGIAIQFGDCEDIENIENKECENVNIIPGSDETRIAFWEKLGKKILEKDKSVSQSEDGESYDNDREMLKKYIHAIFPGTVWCGDGDRAKNDSDLGRFKDTDACCRDHDKCQNDLLAGKTKLNLKNNGAYTRSACDCDHKFYECLKRVNSMFSNGIGKTYFNLLKPQCFRCVCPTDDCNRDDGTECKNHCKKYQWLDNSKY